ncbi:phosphotransferase [bacterium]|nr:phosphotransferase [bacterium]
MLTPLAGDASTRNYYRISPKDSSEKFKVILMDLSNSPDDTGIYFLNIHSLFKTNNIPLPEILRYDRQFKWFLLEDLGDTNLYQKIIVEKTIPKDIYYKLICTLLDIQSIKRPQIPENQSAFSRTFDADKFLYELMFFKTHYLKGVLKAKIRKEDDLLLTLEFKKLSKFISLNPQVIAHRDYHSKNVMIKDDRFYIIDFQDARLGPPQYDLVSLLYDSYINLEEDFREELKSRFIDNFKTKNPDFDKREFEQIFHLTALQRNLKAIGTFAYQHKERNKSDYLKFIKPTLLYIKEHFKKCEGFDTLEALLNKYI